jgi:hypothetical protein
MLPDLRAIIAALVTSLGVLLTGFGIAHSLRTAQERIVSPLEEARERLRAHPFAATPPVVIVPPIEDPSISASSDPVIAAASAPARAEITAIVEVQAGGDGAIAAAPPETTPLPADAVVPSDPPSQTAAVTDPPSERFVIESLVCPPATTAPEPYMAAASTEPTASSALPRPAAGIPLPRERPAMGGPAPDEPVITGSLQPSRTTSTPPRRVQRHGAKRMAARLAPRRRPAPRSRPAPRQRGFFETLFGL